MHFLRVRAVTTLALLFSTGAYLTAGAADRGDGLSRQATGAGEWQSREAARGKRGWQIEIERFGDGAVSGRVRLFGSPFERARLVGRVDDDDVYGVLLDDDGRQIGTFSGAVFTNALSGTYRMIDGDEGAWAWNGEHAVRAIKDPAAAIRGSEHSR